MSKRPATSAKSAETNVIIPTWCEACAAVEEGSATPLEVFIEEWEPAGDEEEAAFRRQLQNLVDYLRKEVTTTRLQEITIMPQGILVATPANGRRLTEEDIARIQNRIKDALGDVEVVVLKDELNFVVVNPPDKDGDK